MIILTDFGTSISAFNAAKASLGAAGGTIFIPAGTYIFTKPMILNTPIHVSGEGSATRIEFDIELLDAVQVTADNASIRYLDLISINPLSQNGVNIAGKNFSLQSCNISEFNKNGIFLDTVASGTHITNTSITQFAKYGIHNEGSDGIFYGIYCFDSLAGGGFRDRGQNSSYLACRYVGVKESTESFVIANTATCISCSHFKSRPPNLSNSTIWIGGDNETIEGGGAVINKAAFVFNPNSLGLNFINKLPNYNPNNIREFSPGGKEENEVLSFGQSGDPGRWRMEYLGTETPFGSYKNLYGLRYENQNPALAFIDQMTEVDREKGHIMMMKFLTGGVDGGVIEVRNSNIPPVATADDKHGDVVHNTKPIPQDPVNGVLGWIYTDLGNGTSDWRPYGLL